MAIEIELNRCIWCNGLYNQDKKVTKWSDYCPNCQLLCARFFNYPDLQSIPYIEYKIKIFQLYCQMSACYHRWMNAVETMIDYWLEQGLSDFAIQERLANFDTPLSLHGELKKGVINSFSHKQYKESQELATLILGEPIRLSADELCFLETRILEQERRTRAFLDSMDSGVRYVDDNATITNVSSL